MIPSLQYYRWYTMEACFWSNNHCDIIWWRGKEGNILNKVIGIKETREEIVVYSKFRTEHIIVGWERSHTLFCLHRRWYYSTMLSSYGNKYISLIIFQLLILKSLFLLFFHSQHKQYHFFAWWITKYYFFNLLYCFLENIQQDPLCIVIFLNHKTKTLNSTYIFA